MPSQGLVKTDLGIGVDMHRVCLPIVLWAPWLSPLVRGVGGAADLCLLQSLEPPGL